MATEEELIAIRVAVRQAQAANRDLNKVARALDNVGDEAEQADRKADKAARSITRLGAASSSTRVNIGPLSTSMRGATLVVGGLVLAAEKLIPVALSAGEAVAVLAGGGAGAGGVGLLALGQASGVAALGLGDLTEALGGSEEAARSLSPEAYELYRTLSDARDALQETAEAAMLPGLARGGQAAMRNFGRLQNVVHATASELGDLAAEGGEMLGSDAWGRDISTVGRTNVKIIGDLGDAGLHLADAARHILVEAAPLAEWLAANAEDGAAAAEAWAEGARAGGDLSRFFSDARTDMRLAGESIDHVVDGLGNLFGSQDVDGSDLLADIEQITQRFEDWTESPAVQEDLSGAIRDSIAQGVAAGLSTAAGNMPAAGLAAAEVFWQSFEGASTEGKALIALMTGAKISGAIRGMTPLTPLYVQNVGGIPGAPGAPVTPGGKPGAGTLPVWVKGFGAGAAALIAAELLGELIPGHDPAADIIRPKSQGGQGGAFAGKTPAGFRNTPAGALQERVHDASQAGPPNSNPLHPPGPFEPIVESHVTLKVSGETLARVHTREQAKRNARRR